MDNIYTPRIAVELLGSGYFAGKHHNPCVCTVIPYKDHNVSISMDSSHGDGDLFRSDIRVYAKGKDGKFNVDATEAIRELIDWVSQADIYGNAENLIKIFGAIDKIKGH